MLASTPAGLEYAFQRPMFLIFQTAALAAGVNDVIMFTVPTNEIWELHAASGSTVIGAVSGGTASISANILGQSFDAQVLLGPQTLLILNAQRDLFAGHAAGTILPPGCEFRIHVEAAVLNDVYAFRFLVYKYPRGFFAKPVG